MKARKFLALAIASLTAIAVTAMPASAEQAADTDPALDTNATFTVNAPTGAGLFITVPNDDNAGGTVIDLDGAGSGATVGDLTYTADNTFGTVTVEDTRSLALATMWTATASGDDFVLRGGDALDPNQVAAAATAIYDPSGGQLLNAGDNGTADGLGLGGVALGDGSLVTLTAGTLGAGATVVYAGTGNSQFSWTPDITFTLSPTQVAGEYDGVIYHDVTG